MSRTTEFSDFLPPNETGGVNIPRYSLSNPPQLNQFLGSEQSNMNASKKNGKQLKKKKASTVANQLPPVSIHSAERKIEELQKLAHVSQTLKKAVLSEQQQVLQNNNPIMSSTEAEFLVRQLHNNEPSSLSILSNPVEMQYIAKGMGEQSLSAPRNLEHSQSTSNIEAIAASNSSKILETLREKLQQAEKQLTVMQSNIQKKEDELEKKDRKVKALQIELERVKLDANNDLKRLQNEVRILFDIFDFNQI